MRASWKKISRKNGETIYRGTCDGKTCYIKRVAGARGGYYHSRDSERWYYTNETGLISVKQLVESFYGLG